MYLTHSCHEVNKHRHTYTCARAPQTRTHARAHTHTHTNMTNTMTYPPTHRPTLTVCVAVNGGQIGGAFHNDIRSSHENLTPSQRVDETLAMYPHAPWYSSSTCNLLQAPHSHVGHKRGHHILRKDEQRQSCPKAASPHFKRVSLSLGTPFLRRNILYFTLTGSSVFSGRESLFLSLARVCACLSR